MDNSVRYWVEVLAIGLMVGWLAGVIVKGRGFGIVGDIVVGVLGAVVGGWLFGVLGLTTYGTTGMLITSLVGALVLVSVTRFFRVTA